MKIVNVVGARPNFMKIAPLMEAYKAAPHIEPVLVHTGQHYDERMSEQFFRDLGIPRPDVNMGVGSGSHAMQTAQVMIGFERVLLEHKPDAVLVVGDVNSTIACGLVAVKLGIRLLHVEAGLRSNDRSMPEEINRVLTDSISDMLFCTEQSGVNNLKREGINGDRVHLVGNLMIDTLLKNVKRAEASTILADHQLTSKQYAVLTLHRPANVDDPQTFGRIIDAMTVIQEDQTVIFPIHPRTRKNLQTFGLSERLSGMANFRLIDPLGYLEFLKLMAHASVVLTDSGGIQEETAVLRVPCLTLRDNTERPATLIGAANRLVGTDTNRVLHAYNEVKGVVEMSGALPPLWDGRAAQRIVKVL